MKKLNIALLTGGDSSEREVALASAEQVSRSLDKDKYNVFNIDVRGREWLCMYGAGRSVEVDKNDFSLPVADGKITLDYALIMIHGTPGEDGKLQGYFEMMGIPYSTSGFVSSVKTFDKTLCKKLVAGIDGLSLAKEILFRKGGAPDPDAIIKELGLPVFVKPNASGSSCGVTKVKNRDDILPAIEKAFTESDSVLIEEYIAGREFGCGIIATSSGMNALPVTEIIAHKEFFDYEAKYTAGMSDEITPAEIPTELSARLQVLAAEAAKACNCRGIVRADFLVTPDSRIYMIEINSVPGMSAGSIVPKQIAAAGMNMGKVLDIIIEDTRCKR